MQSNIDNDRLDLIVLTWLWCKQGKPEPESKLNTWIKAFLPQGSANYLVPASVERLVRSGDVDVIQPAKKGSKQQFKIGSPGVQRARQFLRREDLPPGATPLTLIANFILPAIALKLPVPGDNKTIQKDFPKLLPLAVCAEHFRFDLPMERGSIAAKLALVKMALSNAQGVPAEKINLKKLPTGELPALVAGPILGAPGTDSKNLEKLLESRAVHLLNVSKATQIKSGVVRQWILGNGRSHDAPPLTRLTQPEVPATIDLPRFAEQVQSAARSVARTNRDSVNNLGDQVLIYYCWQEYQRLFGETPFQWFTEHLIECNKVRLLVLVREDLVPGERAEDFRRSEVHLGASVYHYVRIQK